MGSNLVARVFFCVCLLLQPGRRETLGCDGSRGWGGRDRRHPEGPFWHIQIALVQLG